ncbi:MAG: putative quinol monooxygenase [Kordiimonas sp.]
MAIIRINNFEAKVGDGDALFEKIKALVPMISEFEGCTSCQAVRGQENTNQIVIIEGWETIEAHKASLASVPPETFAPVMALLAGPPDGAYYTDA